MAGMSLIYLMAGIGLTGCNRTLVYVLDQKEIMMVKKGEVVTVPFDGTFYSARAEDRVMNAKVTTEKLK